MALTDERKLLLLGILRQSEMHGYLLNAHLDGAAPISFKKPTAYNLLERMHTDGWVSYRDEPTGDRPRRVYALTETGEQAFLKLLRKQLQHFAPAEFPSLVSLSFLDALPVAEALAALRKRREALEAHRELLVTETGGDATDQHHAGTTGLVVTYLRRSAEMESQFLNEAISHLETKQQ